MSEFVCGRYPYLFIILAPVGVATETDGMTTDVVCLKLPQQSSYFTYQFVNYILSEFLAISSHSYMINYNF